MGKIIRQLVTAKEGQRAIYYHDDGTWRLHDVPLWALVEDTDEEEEYLRFSIEAVEAADYADLAQSDNFQFFVHVSEIDDEMRDYWDVEAEKYAAAREAAGKVVQRYDATPRQGQRNGGARDE